VSRKALIELRWRRSVENLYFDVAFIMHYYKPMIKNFITISILSFLFLTTSCSFPKHTATVKINDLDSVIRIVNPNHNCKCNWGDKSFKLYSGGSFSKYSYFWQASHIQNVDSFDILNESKKIKDQIIKLEPTFNEYNRILLEYRTADNTNADTTIKYKVVGTWISYKNGCSGFVKDMNAKKLVKKSGLNSFKEKLCK
jgi:hypothetical protein